MARNRSKVPLGRGQVEVCKVKKALAHSGIYICLLGRGLSVTVDIFGNWIESQMAFIDTMTITEFKGRVRKEARRLNTCGLS